MNKTIFATILAVLVAVTLVFAQTPAPVGTSYELQVLISATATTVTRAIPGTSVTCNLAPTAAPVGSLINPTNVEFDDSLLPGRVCRASVGNFFTTLPTATNYVATITAIDTTVTPNLVSDRSAASNPFDAARARPAARTGLAVRP